MLCVMKNCFKCGLKKSASFFYKHPSMKDGRLNKCIECTKLDNTNNRNNKLDYYRRYDRKRSKLPHRLELLTINCVKYRKNNPEKYKAHQIVNSCLRSGKIKKRPCEYCGTKKRICAHHDDYSKPLDIIWLCTVCHHKRHKGIYL
jgi:hypothetical protein